MIETDNLQLIPCDISHIEVIMRDKMELGPMLNIGIPDAWPEFPESIPHVYHMLKSGVSSPEWGYHIFIHTRDRMLVGEGGFKGKPDEEGVVEIGYAIIPEYRRRGLAFEAARALTHHAFSHPEVNVVQAHTLPDGIASINVLKKLGMKFVGSVHDPEDGEVLRWSVERKNHSIADFGLRNAD